MLTEEGLEDEDEGVVAVDEGDAVVGAGLQRRGTGGAAVAVHVDGDVLAQGRHVALSVARTAKCTFSLILHLTGKIDIHTGRPILLGKISC